MTEIVMIIVGGGIGVLIAEVLRLRKVVRIQEKIMAAQDQIRDAQKQIIKGLNQSVVNLKEMIDGKAQ